MRAAEPGGAHPEEWESCGSTRPSARGSSRGALARGAARRGDRVNHHEHWDGEGYPEGSERRGHPHVRTARDGGRRLRRADVGPGYRKAWPAEQVLAYIRQYAGKRFDPRVAALLDRTDVRHALLAIRAREAPRLQPDGDPYGTARWALSSEELPVRAK